MRPWPVVLNECPCNFYMDPVATVCHLAPGRSGMNGGQVADTRAASMMAELGAGADRLVPSACRSRYGDGAGNTHVVSSSSNNNDGKRFASRSACLAHDNVCDTPGTGGVSIDFAPRTCEWRPNRPVLKIRFPACYLNSPSVEKKNDCRLFTIQSGELRRLCAVDSLAAAVPSQGWPTLNVASLPLSSTSSALVHPHHNGLYAQLARQERHREELRQALVAQSLLNGSSLSLPATLSLLPQPAPSAAMAASAAASLAPLASTPYEQQLQLQELLNRLHP